MLVNTREEALKKPDVIAKYVNMAPRIKNEMDTKNMLSDKGERKENPRIKRKASTKAKTRKRASKSMVSSKYLFLVLFIIGLCLMTFIDDTRAEGRLPLLFLRDKSSFALENANALA